MQEVVQESVTPLFVMLALPLVLVGILALVIRRAAKSRGPRNE